jgi:DNA topoisomerase I
MKKNLVIVESPAKARTLARILGDTYELKASMGHVRDLPKSQLGVDVENDFSPKYVIPKDKSKLVKELKAAAKEASTIYLATDPDREGEAISWHLAEIAGENKRFRRVVFHEITEDAIQQAFKHPRDIDMDLVNAQQARRILDRLVGYKISPLLWRKVRRGLSAGRVQSVALRIIVDREREIGKFVPVEYWSIEAELERKQKTESAAFSAVLVGHLNGNKIELHTGEEANALREKLGKATYSVLKVKARTTNRQPPPPFITSTMQQEAWRKLRFTAEQTMAIAQQLYEGLNLGDEGSVGLITYMRTDSTHIARPAIAETRDYIQKKYGEEYLPPHARTFATTVKGAQEAHEAIRPTSTHREPTSVKEYLNNNQFRLYDLIWKRLVASQMAAAVFDNVTVDIEARATQPRANYLFRTSSSVNRFQGYLLVYTEGRDTDDEEPKESKLPVLADGDPLDLLNLLAEQHFTQPPPRYTEATLIKTLEQFGIGRPSTYAPIVSTLRDREYVEKIEGSLKPTELGMIVTDILAQYFADVVDIQFTARMENELDEVAEQKRNWVSAVKDFYAPFQINLDKAAAEMERVKLPEETIDETCPNCGKTLVVKTGRFGKFVACPGYPECKFTKRYQIKTGVKCPKCGTGDLLQRVSKKKRTFYGCSNYPNCDFAINQKPLPDPCPKCGSLVTVQREKYAKCTKCDYRAKLPQS